jgi:hypothetical protein
MDASPYVYQPNTNQDPDHATEIICSSANILLKDGCKSICLSTQYQSRFGLYILYLIVPPNMNQRNIQLNQGPEQSNQDQDHARVCMFFLIKTPKGCMQLQMFIDQMLVAVWPLHSKWYSRKDESNEMTEPTKTISTQTKNQTMLQSLYLLPHS